MYEWNTVNTKREKECVLKSCGYTSIAVSPDMKTTFAVGSDQTIKEMNLADSQVCAFFLKNLLHYLCTSYHQNNQGMQNVHMNVFATLSCFISVALSLLLQNALSVFYCLEVRQK